MRVLQAALVQLVERYPSKLEIIGSISLAAPIFIAKYLMHVFTDTFTQDQLLPYVEKILEHYTAHVGNHPTEWESWGARTVDITGDSIVKSVIDIIESEIRIKLICYQAQIQIWPEGVNLSFHKHEVDIKGRNQTSFYNSMLYLNDDFRGGEFVTEQGIKIEPRSGTLTFFNGNNVRHGVSPFYGNHRYTIIFWWSRQSHWI